MRKQQGFTLIELLVVIAIIGILSAVVLASLNTARSKGNDAAVKANLTTVGTQAALYLLDNSNSYGTFNNGSGYAGVCPAVGVSGATVFHNATIERAIAAARANSAGSTAGCYAADTVYAVAVSRPAAITDSSYWCVDSAGTHCGVNSFLTLSPTGTCGGGTCASTK